MGKAKLIGHTNWNTDFAVNGPFTSYKLFFTADSTANGTYPVEAFLKFTDGSNLRVVKESLTPPIGTGRMFGPLPFLKASKGIGELQDRRWQRSQFHRIQLPDFRSRLQLSR